MTTVDELRARKSFLSPSKPSFPLISSHPVELADLQLETRGNKDALRLRLARAQSRARSPELPLPAPTTRPDGETYDHFLVVDVEATCEKIEGPYTRLAFSYPNEVIELPVNLLTWSRTEGEDGGEPIWSLVVVDEFHSFVRPTWNPTLSSFCKELTGILQVRLRRNYCPHLRRNGQTLTIFDLFPSSPILTMLPSSLRSYWTYNASLPNTTCLLPCLRQHGVPMVLGVRSSCTFFVATEIEY